MEQLCDQVTNSSSQMAGQLSATEAENFCDALSFSRSTVSCISVFSRKSSSDFGLLAEFSCLNFPSTEKRTADGNANSSREVFHQRKFPSHRKVVIPCTPPLVFRKKEKKKGNKKNFSLAACDDCIGKTSLFSFFPFRIFSLCFRYSLFFMFDGLWVLLSLSAALYLSLSSSAFLSHSPPFFPVFSTHFFTLLS